MTDELVNCPLTPAHKVNEVRYIQVFRVKRDDDGKEHIRMIPEELDPETDQMEV